MQLLVVHRRFFSCLATLTVLVLLSVSCVKYTYYPVVVEEVELSPVYRLDIVNQTSHEITVLPIRKFRLTHSPKVIANGQRISCLFQVSRLKVGQTHTREVVAGPYIENGRLGPDLSYIQFQDERSIKRDIVIDLSNAGWFTQYTVSMAEGEPKPRTIAILLTDESLSKTKWFVGGPDSP